MHLRLQKVLNSEPGTCASTRSFQGSAVTFLYHEDGSHTKQT